ncbi:MAG TPA: DUF2513 domain-containing protein [Terriglobia bacterium]|nr:DUF2513 domain-containing protein [Terriglobia bacterium]
MQLDLDLVRKILLTFEADDRLDMTQWYQYTPQNFGLDDSQKNKVIYHVIMLVQGGFVDGNAFGGAIMPAVRGVTLAGHGLLSSMHNDTVWRQVKRRVKPLGHVTLQMVADIATAVVRKRLGLP